MSDKKVFLIINSYYIGDILLTNPLIQNIKRIYEDSIVVMLTPPHLVDVAKYQEGVDDVIVWDRHNKHKGFKDMMKFVLSFPYKNIYASFPIYSTDRAIMLSKLLGAKYILGFKKSIMCIFMKSKYKAIDKYGENIQLGNVYLLSGLTKESLINCPIKYNIPNLETEITNKINSLNGDYIVLCPKSSNVARDMSIKQVLSIIEKYCGRIVLIGNGQSSSELSEIIKEKNNSNVIDLTNKTTILESMYIIKHSKCCVSANTGMLHATTALNKPVVGVFYDDSCNTYQPSEEIYPNSKILYNKSNEEIVGAINSFVKEYQLLS